jgi:prolyl 4-hydroxylase
LTDIDYRTASLVRIPRSHQEHVQVLRYGEGEKYVSHHDYFDPNLYQKDASTLELIRHGVRNRLATVFWYLTTVEEGGETVFPRAFGNTETSFEDCETGLKVKPEAGKVIIFYSMTPDGNADPKSLHGACPVKKGIKWAANKVRCVCVCVWCI